MMAVLSDAKVIVALMIGVAALDTVVKVGPARLGVDQGMQQWNQFWLEESGENGQHIGLAIC